MLNFLLAVTLGAEPQHERMAVNKANVDIVRIPMSGGEYRAEVVLAAGFPGSDESFASMVSKPGAVAAINGAYFDRYTKKPIGDIWTGGSLRNFGAMGTALTIKADGALDILRVQRHKRVDWAQFETVLACGPALVLDGRVDCDPSGEGFRDPAVMGRVTRMGVGYTANGDLLLVRCAKAAFSEFATVMLKVGCHEAMNLDSGASAALWLKGKTLVPAGRRLTNVLAVFRRTD